MMNVEGQESAGYPKAVRGSAGIPLSLEQEVLITPYNDIEQTIALIEKHHARWEQ
jgi:glutamate-1-semialdehyde aminotransferase